jgi:hypothetical protein
VRAIPPNQTGSSHAEALNELVATIIPEEIRQLKGDAFFEALDAALPIPYSHFSMENGSATATIAVACQATYTLGTGRYLSDICDDLARMAYSHDCQPYIASKLI